jgi:hypothetical protein
MRSVIGLLARRAAKPRFCAASFQVPVFGERQLVGYGRDASPVYRQVFRACREGEVVELSAAELERLANSGIIEVSASEIARMKTEHGIALNITARPRKAVPVANRSRLSP